MPNVFKALEINPLKQGLKQYKNEDRKIKITKH